MMPTSEEAAGTQVTLKAHDGNRSQNLLGIAQALERIAKDTTEDTVDARVDRTCALRGYAEQLRIIADEIAPVYAVHYRGRHSGTACGYSGVTTNEQGQVTCEKCREVMSGSNS